MSAKWRALQHRHRYTYSAIIFPNSFTDSLTQSNLSQHHPKFHSDIIQLLSLNSIYTQVNHAKTLITSFTQLLTNSNDTIHIQSAIRFYLEILFMDNSLPLHRTLISSLAKISKFHSVINSCFCVLCDEYSGKRFCVSRVALSVLGIPKLGYLVDVVEDSAVLICNDIVMGLDSILKETEAYARPPPTVMEQVQEALSCSYYLFQRFPLKFREEDGSFMEKVFDVLMRVLKSVAFSRDCYVAAGVSLCAALQVFLNEEELCLFLAKSMFRWSGDVTDVIVPFDGDEISSFSSLSRLCLIRGILTSVSREVLVSGCDEKTILYDGILPELCDLCENPVDSHLNFHALTVMQICLQQIKTSVVTDSSVCYDRIFKIIWNNLEDPLSQTVKQVHLIFDLLLDIQVGTRESLLKIVEYLLRLGTRCKGRYVPLASLTKRLGAKTLLNMSPNLLFEMANAYVDDDVCCAVTSFIKCFLELLRDECWTNEGVNEGYVRYREHCLPPFLYGLASGMSKLRSNLNTYAVQVLLGLDVDSIFPLLAFISIGPSEEETKLSYISIELTVEQKVAVLVSLLKVCRTLAFLEGDIEQKGNDDEFAFLHIKGIELKVPIEWLKMALTHVDESVRVDAAETLFLNPKTASLPSPLELYLMKSAVPLNMRSSSTGFQMKWTSLFRKFFTRVRTSLEKQYKLGSWQPRAESLFKFMKWLSSFLYLSCYPSAPYRRKIMATELIQIMIEFWPVVKGHQGHLYPYCDIVTSHDLTLLLVGSIVDSWDRLRENSFRILLHFPTPFTGVSSEDMVNSIIPWAKQLVCSPRVRESDAGALTLRLIFRKYVLDLGWIVKVSTDVVCCESERGNGVYPVIEYIKSMIHWLEVSVEEGERDLAEACKNSFVHGVLLALRYTFEELDWNSKALLSSVSEMRKELEKLLELVTRITSIALWVVSADALCLPEDMDDMMEDDSFLSEVQEDASAVLSEDHKNTDPKPVHESVQSQQVVMVGCWLAMKEVSLLLGTIIRKIPLPAISLSPLENGDSVTEVPNDSKSLLDLKQLGKIGDHFLEVLLKMKHHGAIDKTKAGFTALCHRLLCSNDPRLCKLTESWMEQLMERTIAKGQTVDNVLRRSAGIPAAFIALFLSEPEGSPKKLLPQALRWLIDLAEKPLTDPKGSTVVDSEKLSKVRDEGVVPTVHAFNSLKAAFNDANLGTDTSGFSAEAMIVSIKSFSSPYWEVRNSATLAYTSLLRRMIGFLNVQKHGSTRRALTGLEFFHRYPLLHPFVYTELKAATDMLDDSNLANHVHPSLWPILILLSRLKPSPIASETGDDLDPFVFMPFIMKCSTQSNLRVRVLASRALVGLVSNEKLHNVIFSIASTLPSSVAQCGSFNYLHGVLLQLGNLLDTNCRDLVDESKKDQIIGKLIDVHTECKWMASCPCPIISTSFLRMLDHMRVIEWTRSESSERTNLKEICKLSLDLSMTCLDTDSSYGFSYYDPTIAELREQAAVSYFGCVFQPSDETDQVFQITQTPKKVHESSDLPDLNKRLLRCLSDQSYEVRLATLKWFLQFVKSESFSESIIWKWAKDGLQVTLLELLDKEKNHKCENYILRILSEWNKKSSVEGVFIGSLDYDSVLRLWERLTSLYETTRRGKIRGTLMCCLAICVKHITSSLFEEGRVLDCVSYFVNLIKQKSSSSEQANVRQASAEAIIASGLLEQAKLIGPLLSNEQTKQNAYAYQILEMWFTCIKLLEDEEDLIRSKLATDVQKCFSSTAMEVPTQVEKVLELSFNHLSLVFGHWDKYSQYLSRWIFNTADYTGGSGDLARRIFDKEIDNHHEEKLLILQLCCYHLQKLLNGDRILDWRSKFYNRLLSFGKDHVGKQRESWVGGVGNHKDVFLPLYGNLLGLYVFTNNNKTDIAELGEALKPFLKNPIVSNMFRSVVGLHETSIVITGEIWEGFDPYFLLK